MTLRLNHSGKCVLERSVSVIVQLKVRFKIKYTHNKSLVEFRDREIATLTKIISSFGSRSVLISSSLISEAAAGNRGFENRQFSGLKIILSTKGSEVSRALSRDIMHLRSVLMR